MVALYRTLIDLSRIDKGSPCENAEGVGFEPTRACALPVFKTGAINHSTTPPRYCGGRGFCHCDADEQPSKRSE